MRILLTVAMLVIMSMSIMGQDVVIEAKKQGTEMVLIATNNENSDVTVIVELEVTGYDIGSENEIEVLIPKNETIEIGRYKRDESQSASFQYGYSLTQTTTTQTKKSTSSSSSSAAINDGVVTTNLVPEDGSTKDLKGLYVYSINNCGRCNYAVEFLESNNISFVEKNMDKNEEYSKEAFKYLGASGFRGGRFTTPMIIHNGKVSYNISDLKGFLKDLK